MNEILSQPVPTEDIAAEERARDAAAPRLSRLAVELDYSGIIKLASYVQQQIDDGRRICDLIIGDFDPARFPLPGVLRQAIYQAYADNQHDYPPLEGVLPLRAAIADLCTRSFQVEYDPASEIIISGGARPLLYLALLAVADPGDTVVYPAPSWNNMYYATLCGAKGVAVETTAENQFLPTAQDFLPYLREARAIALCSPQNPVGTMFSRQALEEICDLVVAENRRRRGRQKPLYIVFDQVYWMLSYQALPHYQPVQLRPELKAYTIVVDGGSKAFAATGLRVGWGMGPADVIDKMKLMIEHIGAIAPKAEQLAMAALLHDHALLQDHLATFKAQIFNSLQLLHAGMQRMKAEGLPVDAMAPMGGIYLSMQFNLAGRVTPAGQVLRTPEDVSRYLIDHAGLAVVPFSYFGMERAEWWFRAAVCAVLPEQIESALPRVRDAIIALGNGQ
ncbi:pyridoxal phosphate-dependent aminotransferase [Serratia rubidaea]|uniref:Aspartate aminotransferase n=1 Tax=Serratia rubidaea TaxID=61652 RepID=A0A448SCC2_SERRU|nr:pyridoxal phosphate-dependent aminotransferase [Serratia rubidaea]MBH1930313.1 pyridoxal phosphate-dependent aminotransferase [Serratia rubidaea]VEI65313.1 Aspartate aminotransferase [Serratia rubidaea]